MIFLLFNLSSAVQYMMFLIFIFKDFIQYTTSVGDLCKNFTTELGKWYNVNSWVYKNTYVFDTLRFVIFYLQENNLHLLIQNNRRKNKIISL